MRRWQDSMIRFKHIFGLNEQRSNSYIPIHYLSGNHDIGYSAYYMQHPEVDIDAFCLHFQFMFYFVVILISFTFIKYSYLRVQ